MTPWLLIRLGNVGGVPPIVEKRGGAFYPTQEELRELRRRRTEQEARQRENEASIEATIREAYQDAAHPEIKIEQRRREAERQKAIETVDLIGAILNLADETFH